MGYKVGALSWDKDFKDFFENKTDSSSIRVHSVFNRVINIKSSDEILYTIANKHTDNAPYTLKLDFDENFKDIISKEDKIAIEKDSIVIGNMEISLSDLPIQSNARKRMQDLSMPNIKANIKVFNALISELGEEGGCKAYYLQNFLGIYDNSKNLIEKEMAKRIDAFYNDLINNKLDENNIKSLIGLGAGLTPSGDDFLTGFLASVGSFNFNKDVVAKTRNYIYPLLGSTTDISAAMLKATLEDKYREYLNQFVFSFFECGEEKFNKAFEDLLTIGSSSGTDMSVGVVIGFLYTIGKIENKGGL